MVVVESDKADMDVETFYDGYLACIVINEGEVAPVGAAIGLLAETEGEIAEAKAKGAQAGGGSPAPAAAPAPSPVEEKVLPPPSPPSTPAPVASVQVEPEAAAPEVSGDRRIIATPYAKKLAKQFKLDLSTIAGTGPSGRITGTDVENASGKGPSASAVAAPAPSVASPSPVATAVSPAKPAPSPTPTATPAGSVAFTTMQAAVARNMLDSMSVPTFRVGYTITTDALDSLYKKVGSTLQELFQEYQVHACQANVRGFESWGLCICSNL